MSPIGAPAGAPAPSQAAQTALPRRQWLVGALGLGAAAAGLAGCATVPGDTAIQAQDDTQPEPAPATRVVPFSDASPGQPPAGWLPYAMRKDLTRTRYTVVREGPRQVLNARATASATGLRCAVQIDPAELGQLQFSWRVRDVPPQADVSEAVLDDCPARLILAFDGDETRLPLGERLLFDKVELFTGQRLPYATLMYVWDGGRHAVESVHRNHRSTRIQYLTVESGAQRAGRWLHYQRDVVADFRRVFGEAPGNIIGVGVLTDADALKLQLEAWYGDITLAPGPVQATTG
ncbi:MAG: DUF3047 domain-containing protein [Aquabacterium sp.]|nr:DUF3047 domain-containing protein [Aquabacterium sp.]